MIACALYLGKASGSIWINGLIYNLIENGFLIQMIRIEDKYFFINERNEISALLANSGIWKESAFPTTLHIIFISNIPNADIETSDLVENYKHLRRGFPKVTL